MITRNSLSLPRLAAVLTGFGGAVLLAAGPAAAADTVDILGLTPASVEATYSCAPTAGVTGVKAMIGGPVADGPSATGAQTAVTCDGNQQRATIALVAEPGAAPLEPGALVQVRVALVDSADIVVAGQAKVFALQG